MRLVLTKAVFPTPQGDLAISETSIYRLEGPVLTISTGDFMANGIASPRGRRKLVFTKQ